MMRFEVLTLFPGLFEPFQTDGVLGRAVESGLVGIGVHDLRRWSGNRWGQVDDEPYGGGAGMVIQAPPVLRAVKEISAAGAQTPTLVMLSPRGQTFDQKLAEEFRGSGRVLLMCGRYEGFDERVNEILSPLEVSLGDFILGGGEVAAMAVIEAVARLVPGVVGDPDSVAQDSFEEGLLDYPCYTRPAEVEGCTVPPILSSGHHEKIRRWRLERAVDVTVTRRPDLIKKNWGVYSDEVRRLIRRYAAELTEAFDRPRGREE